VNAELVGGIAAFLTTIAFVPQVWKVWRTRSARDVSLGMYLTFLLGVGLWFVYGLMLEAWPIIVANGVTGVLAAGVVLMKLRFERGRPDRSGHAR
jgi:MtN3 and saliva related transmembrane protein